MSADTKPQADIPLPPKFYKYRSLATKEERDRVESIIFDHKIYFTAPSSFNDPFDCRPVFDTTASKTTIRNRYSDSREKLDGHLSRQQRREDNRAMLRDPFRDPRRPLVKMDMQDEFTEYLTKKTGVFCVTTVRDDILMWSHYADCHRGICLEFDGTKNLMQHASQIIYTEERVPIRLYSDDNSAMLKKALLTKSNHWEYENEWRLLRYKEGPGEERFEPENLTGIIFGAQADSAHIAHFLRLIKEDMRNVDVYQSKTDRLAFKLHIVRPK